MKLSQMFPSTYLKAEDLRGREVTVRIDRVEVKDVGGEPKAIVYFEGKQKGLVLNRTNGTTIADSLKTEEMDEWAGEEIVLYTARVLYQGKPCDSIRVRLPSRRQRAEAPSDVEREAPPPRGEPLHPNGGLEDEIPF